MRWPGSIVLSKHCHGQLSLQRALPRGGLCTLVAFLQLSTVELVGVLLRNSEAMNVRNQSGPGWDRVAWYELFDADVSPSRPLFHIARYKEVSGQQSSVLQSPSLSSVFRP